MRHGVPFGFLNIFPISKRSPSIRHQPDADDKLRRQVTRQRHRDVTVSDRHEGCELPARCCTVTFADTDLSRIGRATHLRHAICTQRFNKSYTIGCTCTRLQATYRSTCTYFVHHLHDIVHHTCRYALYCIDQHEPINVCSEM